MVSAVGYILDAIIAALYPIAARSDGCAPGRTLIPDDVGPGRLPIAVRRHSDLRSHAGVVVIEQEL